MDPSLRPPGEIRLRRAVADDAAALTAIAFSAKRSWGYPETWLHAWAAGLTATPELIDGFPAFVALLDERIAGWTALRIQNTDAHLEHLWIDPPAMRRGLGRALFQHAESVARAAGAHRLFILSDPHAESFYRRHGAHFLRHEPAPVNGTPRHLPLLLKPLR